MFVLQSDIVQATGLQFSPSGTSLLAVAGSTLQVWPRWLSDPPRKPATVPHSLERYAFAPDGKKVHLYLSGNSRTRALTVSTGKSAKTAIPEGGPAWIHCDTEGGFVISSHGRGSFARYDLDPGAKTGFRETWKMERKSTVGRGKKASGVGSHYYFGAIGGGGTFVSLEYRFDGGGEPYDGLVVRSVEDGSVLYKQAVKTDAVHGLLENGLKLAVHPSGEYFAIPHKANVRLWPMAKGVTLPTELEGADTKPPRATPVKKKAKAKAPAPSAGRRPKPECNGVAFHPSGALLAAVGNDGIVKLYDTATWEVARTFAWDIGPLRAVCFTPDGTQAATIGAGRTGTRGRAKEGGKVVVWDLDL